MFKSISCENVTVLGDLGRRLISNAARLESDVYRPDMVYKGEDYDWPADFEGRLLLALVRQLETTHREGAYMREIFDGVYDRMNGKGYLGRVLFGGVFDEQQLSGHNWLLRALLEYARYAGDKRAENAALRIIENLYLPLRGAYRAYPTDPSVREKGGGKAGSRTDACVNGWILSTDIGCAYMCLDALGTAYRDLRVPGLCDLLCEMTECFSSLDLMGLSVQTHAALSAVRGMIRFYEATGDKKLLDRAAEIFTFYTENGMTENYANHNWFGRPLWTEPCAIADSLIAALELYKLTGDVKRFETAQRIYYGAFCRAQRSNGGFGCDNCVGAGSPLLTVSGDGGDAYWCCTMRGAEGLAGAAGAIALEKDGVIHMALYSPAVIKLPGCTIDLRTSYPDEGKVSLDVKGTPPKGVIALYLPSYARAGARLCVNGEEKAIKEENGYVIADVPGSGGKVTLDFDIPVLKRECRKGSEKTGYAKYEHGFVLLGARSEEEAEIRGEMISRAGKRTFKAGKITLSDLCDACDIPMEKLVFDKRRILFRE